MQLHSESFKKMSRYRLLKGAFKKCTYKRSFLALAIASIWLYMLNPPHIYFNTTIEEPFLPKRTTKIKRYDLLLSSYMRSGSTLTGMIFGHRPDSFYFHEPLSKITYWTYWHGNNTLCRSDRLECRHMRPEKQRQEKAIDNNFNRLNLFTLDETINMLHKIYDCKLIDFDWDIVKQIHVDSGGPSWKMCKHNKKNITSCLQQYIPRSCKHSLHKVTKVLRLTTDILSILLATHTNIKVFHLFRDPRAIINSRIHTSWYPSKTDDEVIDNAKSLCNKMLYDFRKGEDVLREYPNRFKFIYYEDLSIDILSKSKLLYTYLGMDVEKKYFPHFLKHWIISESERRNNTAFWWRNSLNWTIVDKMENICKDVYTVLGYRSFSNFQEYVDLSIPSIIVPKAYLIVG